MNRKENKEFEKMYERDKVFIRWRETIKYINDNDIDKIWIQEIIDKGYMTLEDYNHPGALSAEQLLDCKRRLEDLK